jgi:hypothetical protein
MTPKTHSQDKAAADKEEARRIEANSNLTAPSAAEKAAAQKEGILDRVKENAGDTYDSLTDGVQIGDPPKRQWHGYDEIQMYAHHLDSDIDTLTAAIDEKAPNPIPEEKVYGLLALERNGQNRTPYVKAFMKRLDLKADELPGGGPGYTNDVTNISKL